MSFPFVSVIVPIYNGESDLSSLLSGLFQQTYPSDRVEYLLVDNNSSDRTYACLMAAQAQATQQGLTVRVLQETQIQSAYAARNQGMRAAQGDLLVFTDADCCPRPTWLSQLVSGFADPAVGLVAGEIVGAAGKTLLERYASYVETLSQTHTLKHPFCPYGQTANLAVRRQVLAKVGLFRPYLTTGGDADFCWRILRQTDWRLGFVAEAIVEHHHRSTLQELGKQWRRYGRSNQYLHQLHGIPLMLAESRASQLYTLGRWLGKELPINGLKVLRGKLPVVALLSTPLGLYCSRARFEGQQTAVLPEEAQEIEWLEVKEKAAN